MSAGLIIDAFAGGGGASVGIEAALGHVDVAINHNPRAIAMHRANHPHTLHYHDNLMNLDAREVVQGRPVFLAWFSPDCTHFSKAKGGRPVSHYNRMLAEVVVDWVQRVRPRIFILENVEEFKDWGPLLSNGRPCPVSKGITFRRWIRDLKKEGYRVEWRELRACDYGSPTIRKRLFVIGRCDGLPVVWPRPTHGPGLLPFLTAASCIDFTQDCPSIFGRERELAPKTLARIYRGLCKHVRDAADPFIIHVTHNGDLRTNSIHEPLRTITCANRGEQALITPHLMMNNTGNAGSPATEPVPTVTTGNRLYSVAPFFAPRYGERPEVDGRAGQEPRTTPVDRPAPTIVKTQNGTRLVAAFLAQHNGGFNEENNGRPIEAPLSTIMTRGVHQQLVTSHLEVMRNNMSGRSMEEPVPTLCARANHVAEVRAFLMSYYGTDQNADLRKPLPTVTTRDRFALGMVEIGGIDYQIVDIGMRMLTPRELFNAQGFPRDYILEAPDPLRPGKLLSKTAQIECAGNSVCPQVAEALVRANCLGLPDLSWDRVYREPREAAGQGTLWA